jgi:hypothetical protein
MVDSFARIIASVGMEVGDYRREDRRHLPDGWLPAWGRLHEKFGLSDRHFTGVELLRIGSDSSHLGTPNQIRTDAFHLRMVVSDPFGPWKVPRNRPSSRPLSYHELATLSTRKLLPVN